MKTVLLETNVINKCVEKEISGQYLKKLLSKKNFIPLINVHTTYEMARTFVNCAQNERGRALFKVIHQLNPVYTCMTSTLLKRELENLKSGISYNNIIEETHLRPLLEAVGNLSEGKIREEYTGFIIRREQQHEQDRRAWDNIACNSNRILRAMSFIDFKKKFVENYNILQLIRLLYQHISIVTAPDAVGLYLKLNLYLGLRTLINSTLYLNYIALREGNKPSRDKTDDFRHLIDSSYCSLLITDDSNLKNKYVKFLNPDLEIKNFEEFFGF